ncbi:MAG: thioredoxin [Acidobacteriota bacterium]
MSEHIKEITDNSFETEVLKSEKLTLVDFWAEWCGPCLALAPTVEEVAKQYAGNLNVAKLNVDYSPDTPPRYGIRGIPTLILFKGGQEVDRIVGFVGKGAIEAMIQKHAGVSAKA